MALLPVFGTLFDRFIKASILPLVCLCLPSASHEVLASSVTVSRDRHNVEVLQTSPIGALRNLTHPSGGNVLAAAQDYASLLKIMSAHWVATSGGSACSLARQAYRALESEHEVQFRFLFTCEEGDQPIRLSASWVEMMPPSHFILLDAVKKNRSVQAIIEERPATIVVPGS